MTNLKENTIFQFSEQCCTTATPIDNHKKRLSYDLNLWRNLAYILQTVVTLVEWLPLAEGLLLL